MAPSSSKPTYEPNEIVLCYHGSLLYEAKVLSVEHQIEGDKKSPYKYMIHYKGWKKS